MDNMLTMPCQSETSMYDAKHGHPLPKSVFGKLFLCLTEMFHLCVVQVCPPYLPIVIRNFVFAPKKATYYFEPKADRPNVYEIRLREGCESLVTEEKEIPTWLSAIDCYFIYPAHTYRLACRYVRSAVVKQPGYVLLFCHANGNDIGFDINIHYYMSWRLKVDVFAFDYSGYGQSSGKPTESNFCNDVVAAYDYLVKSLHVDPNKIVAFGQSLGTAAAIELASKGVQLRGLILDGLLLSAFRILYPKMQGNVPCDQLINIDKIPKIKCPTLVIHGVMDQLTNFQHAERFFELCQNLVPPLIIPNGHHLDLMNYRAYWNRLEIFFCKEIGNRPMKSSRYCNPFCNENHQKNPSTDPMHMKIVWPFESSTNARKSLYND